jgi:competence protein ComEC
MVYPNWLTPSRLFGATMVCWLLGCILPIIGYEVYIILFVAAAVLLLVLAWDMLYLRLILACLLTYCASSMYYNKTVTRLLQKLPTESLVQLRLTVLDNPDMFDDQLRYVAHTAANDKIYITVHRQSPLTLGTTYDAEGRIKPADKIQHLRQGVIGRISQPKLSQPRPARLTSWQRILRNSRSYFERTITLYFPEPEAALYAGIVAGIRSGIPESVSNNFSTSGLSHIIAVSGFNVTVLVGIITRFTKQLGRIADFLVAVATILSFVVFAGGSASVVRAGILASLFIFARTIGRVGSMHRLLLFVACSMSILNPLIVRYDIGFQLSFFAVLGLTLYCEPIVQLLERYKAPPWLAESIAATTAAQITTLPIILYYFGTLSPYSVLANVLVEPFIPIITLSGPLFIALSALYNQVLVYISIPVSFMLKYILLVSGHIASMPNSALSLAEVSIYLYLIYYGLIFLPFLLRSSKV